VKYLALKKVSGLYRLSNVTTCAFCLFSTLQSGVQATLCTVVLYSVQLQQNLNFLCVIRKVLFFLGNRFQEDSPWNVVTLDTCQ